MVTQSLEDILVTDKEISGYMDKRDNQEHTKIKSPYDYLDDVKKHFSEDLLGGISLPFKGTDESFKVRLGELSVVTGFSGHGKSAWLNQCILGLMKHEKAMIASFEMTPRATLARMTQQTGEALPNEDYIEDFLKQLVGNLYLYDPENETTTKKVLEVIYYCAEKLGVKIMVIDSLMKCGIGEDDLNGQKAFANKIAVACRDLDIHVFLVAHSKKTASDFEHARKFDVAGSANITNMVDNVFSVHRNKEREEAIMKGDTTNEIMFTPPCMVYLVKQRHGKGLEGRWEFDFHPDTFSYSEWTR
jgi:twinkle protein